MPASTFKRLDKIIVVDVESTCWDGAVPVGQESEIIEIGLCELDLSERNWALRNDKLKNLPVRKNKTSILVKPEMSEVSPFCTKLTTITSSMLDKNGISFSSACNILRKDFGSNKHTWASYGDYDRKMFEKNCKTKGVKYPFGPRHINIKNLFAHMWGLDKEVGLDEALKILNKPLEGTHHRGHDDAWNIAEVLSVVLNLKGRELC